MGVEIARKGNAKKGPKIGIRVNLQGMEFARNGICKEINN